jgi:glyoxylase I family protein
MEMETAQLHHIALNATDLERSRSFYRDVLALEEIDRPNFPFPGAWFRIGDLGQHVHLIVHTKPTFRPEDRIDTRDVHFAVRVKSYRAALEHLRARGYREDADERDPLRMILQPHATAGFPQIYILDPDRHVIEINAERLD